MTTASTDQHKDHKHQESEGAELKNVCRETTSHGSPGAAAHSYCPTLWTRCCEICYFQHRCRHMDMEDQPRAEHSTPRGDAPPAPPGTQSWWLLSTLLSHGTSLLCLSHTKLAWQKQQFCQENREDPTRKVTEPQGKRNQPKNPQPRKPHRNHTNTISSLHWKTTKN